MSRTIKAIERHMILPVRLGPRSRIPRPVEDSPRRQLHRNVESSDTLSGHALRKLRLVFAPPYSVTTAGAAG